MLLSVNVAFAWNRNFLWRVSLFFNTCFETKCDAVDTEALAGGLWAIIEHMAKMSVTLYVNTEE